MKTKIEKQILKIRESGVTNMFDTERVSLLAKDKGFEELAAYLETNKKEYWNFILTGKF